MSDMPKMRLDAARRGKQPKPLTPEDPRHGTVNAYQHYKCRCELCRHAATQDRKSRPDPRYRNRPEREETHRAIPFKEWSRLRLEALAKRREADIISLGVSLTLN